MPKPQINIIYDPALLDEGTLMDEYLAAQNIFLQEQARFGRLSNKGAAAAYRMQQIKNLIIDHNAAKAKQ